MKIYKNYLLVYFFVLGFQVNVSGQIQQESKQNFSPIYQLQTANSLLNSNPDSALQLFQDAMRFFDEMNDTVKVVQCHIGIADVYKNKGQYSLSYDHLWEGLSLSKQKEDLLLQSEINADIGVLYSLFDKYEMSIEYLQTALAQAKTLVKLKKVQPDYTISLYYSMAVQFRKAKEFSKALVYLDSCRAIGLKHAKKPLNNTAYVGTEKGIVSLYLNDLKQAEYYLLEAEQHFEKRNNAFLVIIYNFLGDLYVKKKNNKEAISAYKKALRLMKIFHAHEDYRIDILQNLSLLYEQGQQTQLALESLKEANAISDSLFNIKSIYNNRLFQIKDKYRETLQLKNVQLVKQERIIEKNALLKTRLIILIGFLLFTIILSAYLVRFRSKIKKMRMEKLQYELQMQTARERSEEIMQIKSKELTANTLLFIEKEQIIAELMNVIREELPSSYNKINKKVSQGNADMWERFNKLFIEVNPDFYRRLRKKTPELSPTELKHCALIKLKFNTKEMAQLLNISINSVQISRHRIRKKMGLERNENLSNYIGDF
ncbi:tetratricopeptide repeat protein [Flammeovirga sp. EKP202]|uniref:tetratricopeptide repeat protein n=1 Tax=Flammeovirga sp. EKP202 TaxID=2770592 RepID=UPI00165FDE06|nr:tetratricopeptide repeat protein [Flammeovirga sp. EKP202]MBD0404991.1 tetratricopeptide repeat protein [Flammeovirga sp. EKP202]